MEVWEISKNDFNAITADYPGLRNFLTEIVAERFATSRMTAERQIGKYLITDIIGRGGFSIVYKGLHRRLNMPVAIKMLNHDMAMDKEFVSNFQREAITIAQFNHDNIIKVYDVESLGAGWVVRSHQITYFKPAFEGDTLTITTWVADMRSAASLRRYEIRRQDGQLIARAATDWAFVNYEKQRPVRIPPEVYGSFEVVSEGAA